MGSVGKPKKSSKRSSRSASGRLGYFTNSIEYEKLEWLAIGSVSLSPALAASSRASASTFKLDPDGPGGLQQIRSCTRPGHEPSSISPTVLRGAAGKTPPRGVSGVHTVRRGDQSLTQRGSPFVDGSLCCSIPKNRRYRELAGQSYRRRAADADHRACGALSISTAKPSLSP